MGKHLIFISWFLSATTIPAMPLVSKCGCLFFCVFLWHYKHILSLMATPEQNVVSFTQVYTTGDRTQGSYSDSPSEEMCLSWRLIRALVFSLYKNLWSPFQHQLEIHTSDTVIKILFLLGTCLYNVVYLILSRYLHSYIHRNSRGHWFRVWDLKSVWLRSDPAKILF